MKNNIIFKNAVRRVQYIIYWTYFSAFTLFPEITIEELDDTEFGFFTPEDV